MWKNVYKRIGEVLGQFMPRPRLAVTVFFWEGSTNETQTCDEEAP